MVGTDDRPIEFTHGVRVDPGVIAGADVGPDVVVVPGLDDEVCPSLERNQHWVPWIAEWSSTGGREHDDPVVHAAQSAVQQDLVEERTVAALAAFVASPPAHWVATSTMRSG